MSSGEFIVDYSRLFEWEELTMIERSLFLGRSGLSAIIENSIEMLKTMSKDLAKKEQIIEKQWDGSPPWVKNGIMSQILGVEYEIADEIESYHRGGVLLSIFTFFEYHLDHLCLAIDREFDLAKFHTDVNAKGNIKRDIKFLRTVLQIEFTAEAECSITKINDAKDVRNQIAHQNYIIKSTDKRKLKKTEGLQIFLDDQKNGFFRIEKGEYLSNILSEMGVFFDCVLKACDHRFKEVKR